MTATTLTAVFTLLVSMMSAVVIPLYVIRRRNVASAINQSEVSWEAINKALAKERDLQRQINKDLTAAHNAEITELRANHAKELGELRDRLEQEATRLRLELDQEAGKLQQRYDEQLLKANDRISECRAEVNRLYKQLYGPRPASEDPLP